MNALLDFLLAAGYVAAYFVLPFIIGTALGRVLHVRDLSGKIGLVLCTILLGFAPFLNQIIKTERTGYQTETGKWVSLENVADGVDTKTKQPVVAVALKKNQVIEEGGKYILAGVEPVVVVSSRLTFDISRWQDALTFGIDLAGGTNLVYQLAENQGQEPITDDLMSRMVGAVSKRINPAGTKEVTVRRVGNDRIEVIIPGANAAVVQETKDAMTKLGSLEFAILANPRDHRDYIKLAEATAAKDVRVNGKVVARWVPVNPNVVNGEQVPNKEFDNDPEVQLRQAKGRPPGFKEVLIISEPDEDKRITGKLLKRAFVTNDKNLQPAVGFSFNQRGAYLFDGLTAANKPRKDGTKRRLAILLDDKVITAPSINDIIGAEGQITGNFTPQEVNNYVSNLNSGSLPHELQKDPISEFTISPTLGFDVQSKGKLALIVSSIAVVVFMGGYYLIAGLVADFAMMLNLLFIVSVMAFIDAAFTLPGLAGLVLSAGMAVDANVLIYERIREETERGASLRMAIHNGFDKALVAIIDSNLSTLITAVILYMIGTDQVRGFAVSLFIGLVMNLYTAVFVSRLILNIMERTGFTKKLKMLSLIGVTHFDFVGKQFIATTASVILIVAGLTAFVMRGNENYDIDFTGGTMVTFQFTEPQVTDEVRNKLEKDIGANITLEELARTGAAAKDRGKLFRLRTTDQDENQVELAINKTFPNQLVRVTMEFGEIKPISAPKAKEGEKEAPLEGDNVYAGGNEVELSFSDEVAETTIRRSIVIALGNQKVSKADALISLEGSAGSGMTAAEGKVRMYKKMILLTTKDIPAGQLQAALANVQETMRNSPSFEEVTSFASSVASEAKISAVMAILASLAAIIAYVWFRFENLIFGLSAVIALGHDVLVSLGCVALGAYLSGTVLGTPLMLSDFKINMPMIAAFLTIVGYSLNDTIVIFDRLREIRGKNPHITRDMINLTVNQCLSRTILTAFTVFLSVLILYVLGGEGIHGFAFCMLIGSVAGTYSTVYIASPLVLWFIEREDAATARQKVGKQPAAASRG